MVRTMGMETALMAAGEAPQVDEKLIALLATARAQTAALKIQVELVEGECKAWMELISKHKFGVPDELGREPTEQEKRIEKACGEAKEYLHKLLSDAANAKVELLTSELTGEALEQRLPERLRGGGALEGQERRLREAERKLDRILKALEGPMRDGGQ